LTASSVQRVQLGGVAVNAGTQRHPPGGGRDRAAHHASRRNERGKLTIQADPVRHVPAAVAHDHDQRLRIQPGWSGMIVGHHQVRPRAVANGSVELRGEATWRPAGRGRQPGMGQGVLGRVGDIGAQEGNSLAVR